MENSHRFHLRTREASYTARGGLCPVKGETVAVRIQYGERFRPDLPRIWRPARAKPRCSLSLRGSQQQRALIAHTATAADHF